MIKGMPVVFFSFGFLCVLVAGSRAPVFAADPISNEDCLSCHGDPSGSSFVNVDELAASIHGSWACVDCHSDITELPHAEVLKVNCGTCHEEYQKTFNLTIHGKAAIDGKANAPTCADCHGAHNVTSHTSPASKMFWQNIPTTCGKCHAKVLKDFNDSVHGKAVAAGKREAPVCHDCHGEHSISAAKGKDSPVSSAHITETCGQCHTAERITTKYRLPNFVVSTYMESYHGLSVQRGSLTVANCASCHNTHDILPSSDPRSSVHPTNLVATCGQCHAGIGEQVASGKIHSGSPAGLSSQLTNIVRNFYIILIVLVVGMMLLHNILDLSKKVKEQYRHLASLGKPVRMGTSERIQHAFLASSFLALAYTGFALKYPHAWWAIPFSATEDWRWLGHRFAAGIFVLLSFYHVWFLLFTVKGRWQLEQLMPRKIDAVQFVQTFAYYFGRRKEKPRPGFYGYIEKMEYWALVWGSMIMVVTGGILLGKEWFLKLLPKGVLDAVGAVHYYEAILACLAIIVWHWYFVIFDPDVYPMKWTWLDGKSTPADDERTG